VEWCEIADFRDIAYAKSSRLFRLITGKCGANIDEHGSLVIHTLIFRSKTRQKHKAHPMPQTYLAGLAGALQRRSSPARLFRRPCIRPPFRL
jgi:hypothetical protein